MANGHALPASSGSIGYVPGAIHAGLIWNGSDRDSGPNRVQGRHHDATHSVMVRTSAPAETNISTPGLDGSRHARRLPNVDPEFDHNPQLALPKPEILKHGPGLANAHPGVGDNNRR